MMSRDVARATPLRNIETARKGLSSRIAAIRNYPMGELIYQRTIVGYHGCDAKVADDALLSGELLDQSENKHDWLGKGVYFWEHGPQRAIDWAKDEASRAPDKIRTPSVLGAYIHLGQCFDLLDTANNRMLAQLYPKFVEFTEAQGKLMPANKPVPGTAEA